MKARTIGIVAALGLGALVGGCAARETNAEEPAQNSNMVVRIDEQTGTKVEMSFDALRIERGSMTFYNHINHPQGIIGYLNSAGERVEIAAYAFGYDELPLCIDMLISVDGIYTENEPRDEALCNIAAQRWIEVCKELKCLETRQEWWEYTDNLRNTITPERL